MPNSERPETAPDYILDEQVGFLLRLASQRHASIFQAHSLDGLTPTQFSALIRLSEIDECSQNQLGRLISVDVATIKGVVDRLVKKDLVRLRADETDRRRTLISLSAQAREMIDGLHEAGRRISAETLRPLSPTEQATLLRLLGRLG